MSPERLIEALVYGGKMHCPNCGKMLELKEKEFCTGCGADVDGIVDASIGKWDRKKTKSGQLRYGTRYVSSDIAMSAMGKGLVIGGFLGFLFFLYLGTSIFVFKLASSISLGMVGVIFFSLLGVTVASKLSENAQKYLDSNFGFIKTDGVLYNLVDFLCLHLPFMAPDSDDKKKSGKRK